MRKLHIGGQVTAEGWEIMDANANPGVDHVGNAGDLSRFADATFDAIYASHVVEHFDYKDELLATLTEWNRVLVPGGTFYVSVPDLDTLATLFLDKANLTVEERFHVMRMIFGGHMDKFDYHLVGLDAQLLAHFLDGAGFVNGRRVATLGLFEDTSGLTFRGVPISLNVICEKRGGPA